MDEPLKRNLKALLSRGADFLFLFLLTTVVPSFFLGLLVLTWSTDTFIGILYTIGLSLALILYLAV